MAAKTVKISIDSGSTFRTLPGNTGDFKDETSELVDTIFGQNFKSSQVNLIGWMVSANAIYKGFVGYTVDVKQSGSPTSFSGEAVTSLGSHVYKITSASKNVWDRTTAIVVKDGSTDITAQVVAIDYLFGRFTLNSGYSVLGTITVDSGKYLPMSLLAKYKSFSLTQTADMIDTTDVPAAQGNGGHRTFEYGLKTVALSVSGVYAAANGYRAALVARDEVVIEINPDGGEKTVARGFFKPATRTQQGAVGALEEETATFNLTVPAQGAAQTLDVSRPFGWVFTSSDLTQSVQDAITAWQDEIVANVKYLPDGSTGLTGACLIADVSLSGGLEAMNEFSVTFKGTDAVSVV